MKYGREINYYVKRKLWVKHVKSTLQIRAWHMLYLTDTPIKHHSHTSKVLGVIFFLTSNRYPHS